MPGADTGLVVVSTAGRQLEVLVSGPTGGTPIVFHCGTPNGLVAWPPVIDPGTIGVGTIVYARPGYCRSTPHPGRSVADAATDTAAILDALGVDTFLTVGWSGGGPHALACSALLHERCLATAVIAGAAPYVEGVRDWYESDDDLLWASRGRIDAFAERLEKQRTSMLRLEASDMPAAFLSEADRAAITGDYAEWLASCTRSGWSAGVAGVRDDWLAFVRDWGFTPADARRVTFWQGDEDHNVPPAHAAWLADHVPGSELRLLTHEGHMSIGLRLLEICGDLVATAGQVGAPGGSGFA